MRGVYWRHAFTSTRVAYVRNLIVRDFLVLFFPVRQLQ